MKNIRLWAAILFGLIGVAAGVYAVDQLRTKRAGAAPSPPPREAVQLARNVDREELDRALRTATDDVRNLIGAIRMPDGTDDSYVTALEGVLFGYQSDEFADVISTMQSLGIEPSPYWLDNPENMQRTWESRRTSLMLAELDPGGVEVRRIGPEGPPDELKENSANFSSRRDAGRPFLDSIPASERVVVETVLSGTFVSEEGIPFDGRIGVEMTWNPAGQAWVPTAFHSYDVPVGLKFRNLIP